MFNGGSQWGVIPAGPEFKAVVTTMPWIFQVHVPGQALR